MAAIALSRARRSPPGRRTRLAPPRRGARVRRPQPRTAPARARDGVPSGSLGAAVPGWAPRRARARRRACGRRVRLFQLAAPPPPRGIVPPTVAFMTCILAVLVIALLGRDEHGMLLAQVALNAPYAVTTWWLGEQGHFVCFGILALRTFFGAHLSGRFDALLNCFATLGLLIITAPNQAWVWRDTIFAAWLNVAICVYRLATHASSGDGGETG